MNLREASFAEIH